MNGRLADSKRVAIGVSAHMGWVAVATVAIISRSPRVIRTDRIETSGRGDHEAGAPYHLAGGYVGARRVPRPPDPAAIVQRGLVKQRQQTLANFRTLWRALRDAGHDVTCAAVLVGRGRMASSLDRILASHAQIHVAEGVAVREAVSNACRKSGIAVVEIDQKALLETAEQEIGSSREEILAALRATRPENAGPWRQDQKLAAVAAWLALHERQRAKA